MYKFHSRVIRTSHVGGKIMVNYKEKAFIQDQEEAVIDEDTVQLFDTEEEAERFLETQ